MNDPKTGAKNSARERKTRSRMLAHRMQRLREHGLKPPMEHDQEPSGENVALECGWGRLLFSHTFRTPEDLAAAMRAEKPGQRDIAVYIRDPHVAIATAPQELFLDPSHTYRLDLATYRAEHRRGRGFTIRRLSSMSEADAVNNIYLRRKMAPVRPEFFLSKARNARALIHLVAIDQDTRRVLGTVTGVDHARIEGVSEAGSSLWCLAVDPQAPRPGVGEALTRHLASLFHARGAPWMDLSVLHDNAQAIALYEKLGFVRVPFFSMKHKNPINEPLFIGQPAEEEQLNPYAAIIVQEARRRGLLVEVTDAEGGFFRITHGGRTIHCRESLSELTSAVAMSICDDKQVTRRFVKAAGVRVPDQIEADDIERVDAFVARHGKVVIKPARGEQGKGVAVGLDASDDIAGAIAAARAFSDRVLVEQYVEGEDLRLVVIDYQVVAAAIRSPASIIGDGQHTIVDLIERQSRRRAAATGGESQIPLDNETRRCVAAAGYAMRNVLPPGVELQVRKTANLHTGGAIHDVTGSVNPALAEAAVKAARAINIPVTGVDFIVPNPAGADYVFIEANERPGLANHEPQPTAQRFVDLLFPHSLPAASRP
ncbi:glutathione synthase [Camelimonas fluminis]|uniref:N-acetylglutaminylglutamine synthetase n=1 Tax=Camelimonas fluminis TaxID=1576911 RepID=A0ABV7UKL8_9HYPH|nr:N-acetylglutaminylglutamine synthetase [Camelimonas fluminis]GHE55764.1 glutathione synthase [Camelimonas fluminis]